MQTPKQHTRFLCPVSALTLTLERVSAIARPIVVASKQHLARVEKRKRGDSTQGVVVQERVEFTIGTSVKKQHEVWPELMAKNLWKVGRWQVERGMNSLDRIDVRFVAGECLCGLATASDPEHGCRIARAPRIYTSMLWLGLSKRLDAVSGQNWISSDVYLMGVWLWNSMTRTLASIV